MRGKKLMSYARYGYIFSIPFVLAFLVFSLYPILYTAVIGFTDLKGLGKTDFKILEEPFKNFSDILHNETFRESLSNTCRIWIANFIPQLGLALLLTAWFTDNRTKVKGQGLFKVLFYMPNIITAATVAILFGSLFGYPMGPMNDLFQRFGWSDGPVNFLVSKSTARGIVAFIQFWMWYGYTMVLLISGVIGINPEIFEAAEIDGANKTQTFFRVTLPCIRTILLFTLVTSLIGGLNMFDIPHLFIANGGPDGATKTTSEFIYAQAFSGTYMYNRAAAASMIMFVIILALSAVLFFILRDRDEAKLRKSIKRARKLSAHSARM